MDKSSWFVSSLVKIFGIVIQLFPGMANNYFQGYGMANEDAADVASPRRQPTQKTSSKYDFYKVRVWLADHYYTFSRFLISRVLTVTQCTCSCSVLAMSCIHARRCSCR